ncbi:Fic/DOC family N-terminal domain-containing protein [Anaerolineales bacterium HSG6]|nr:Fic/DOC family N-terminal domain-containing protein [Anaerolineales bacterium HSG6]
MKNFKAGQYVNQGTHKSFQPSEINRKWKIRDMALINLLSQADRQLGRLDMYSEYIPNIDLFISMHVLKEASQSNKIEGTKTNIEDALLDREDVNEEKKDDWEEVQNYILALNTAIIGRLIIILYLVEKGLLKKPILYLSDFFERNRTLYYDNLTRVREKNDLIQWSKFFLVGVIETAQNSIKTFDNILKLQKEVDSKLQKLGSRANNAQIIIDYLFQRPIINAQKAKELTNLSLPTVYKLLHKIEGLGIIEEVTGAKRGKLYLFKEYVKLFE